jgi:hypothetical protein
LAIFESEADIILKYRTIIELLAGQVTILDMEADKGLGRYLNKGDNKEALIAGFYTIIEAIEKVEIAQQIVRESKKATGISKFIQKLKQEFKAKDMAGNKKRTSTIH